MNQPIDAVISWVDGHDPSYQKKLADFCLQKGVAQRHVVEPTRINQCGEITYCIQSLLVFAPWLRTLYIVTDKQIPPVVNTLQDTAFAHKIKIIDQADLFVGLEACLPVFNSLTIEWLLHRIDGLSEQFLYLNDDFFLTRPVTPEDFFKNGRIVLRGEWKTQTDHKWPYILKKGLKLLCGKTTPHPTTNPHRHWQEQSAKHAGWEKDFYLLPHAPFPLIKKTFTDLIKQNPTLLAENVAYPFRHPDQLSPLPLMAHLDIKHNRVVFDHKLKAIMVNGACHSFKKIQSRLTHAIKNKAVAFVCMQSVDQAPSATQKHMIDWLSSRIGFQ